MRLSQLGKNEMPREKLLRLGTGSLSDAELLALLLRTGTADQDVLALSVSVLNEWGGLEGLCRATVRELMQHKGLKAAKAAAIAAVVELGKRCAAASAGRDTEWESKLHTLARDALFSEREQIFAIFVDKKGFVLGEDIVSYGGLDGAYMDMAVFMRKAVRLNADSVVLAHNHPGGALLPSGEDVKLTEYVSKSLKLLRIGFRGHYVLAGGKSRRIDYE